ncbi:MAG TPA: hypothetical protein VIH95_09350, partial [Acidimicrobiales bacterium]
PMDHCDECGFTYADHGPATLAAEIAGNGVRYSIVLNDAAVDETRLNARPTLDVWSPVRVTGATIRDVVP